MKSTRLITCNNVGEAYLIKGRLNNEGIECFLTNQHFTNLMPIYNNMLGSGIQIMVSMEQYDKARQIIKEKLQPDNSELACPHCGSREIGLGLGEGRGLKIANILMAIIVALPFGNLRPKFWCKECKQDILYTKNTSHK